MKSVNIYIIAASILLIDNLKCVTGQSCEPRTKSPDLSEIAKFMNDLKSSKWNERTPTSDELFEEVQFWCIEPNKLDFRRIFVNETSNITLPVGFIIHGYTDSIDRADWMKRSARRWVEHEKRAVCLVDWRNFARTLYVIAANNYTRIVSSYVVDLIRTQNFEPNETIVAGHSLGAQIAGFIGKALNGSLKRIYGLDPAGPQFTDPIIVDSSRRLGPGDAQHVQCLHTNCGKIGTTLPCGDSDYYSHFGGRQPGCSDDVCDHMRVVDLFESSIYAFNMFRAQKCAEKKENAENHDCFEVFDRFGIHGNHSNGQFYFQTTDCYPFCFNC